MDSGYETKYEIKGMASSTTVKKYIVCGTTSSNGISAPGFFKASRSSCFRLCLLYEINC